MQAMLVIVLVLVLLSVSSAFIPQLRVSKFTGIISSIYYDFYSENVSNCINIQHGSEY
jgi:uncharacterized protein involved in cysteine biosynthesis